LGLEQGHYHVGAPSEHLLNDSYGNIAVDDVFPVNAGVNTFDIRVVKDYYGDGVVDVTWAT
jgi:hypothetical protein